MKAFIVLCIFVIGVFGCDDNCYNLRVIDSIHQEKPCSSRGGICTIKEDCPQGRLGREQGLCPTQRSRGVECCYGVSVKETRCGKRGGECLKGERACNPILIIPKSQATDCPNDTTCCVLVK